MNNNNRYITNGLCKRIAGFTVICVMVVSGIFWLNRDADVANAQTSQQPGQAVKVCDTCNMPSFADVVENVKPAVVSLKVSAKEKVNNSNLFPNMPDLFNDLPDGHPLRDLLPRFLDPFGNEGKPMERYSTVQGSGFIISADGYLVTNYHVIKNFADVIAIMDDGKEYKADVIGFDKLTDLALLKIKEGSNFPFVNISNDNTRVGDWVVAIGNPFGLGGTVTAGIVSARGRTDNSNGTTDFLQIDAAVNHGNSGGPVFNLKGEVVGVNMAIISPYGGNVGIAFAIPAKTTKNIIAKLRSDGKITRGYLGVQIQDISKEMASAFALETTEGSIITDVMPDTAAAKANLKTGDVIIRVNDNNIKNSNSLSKTVKQMAPGEKIEVTFIRKGKQMTANVTLGLFDHDNNQQAGKGNNSEDISNLNAIGLGITKKIIDKSGNTGLFINAIKPGSAADKANIRPQSWLISINGEKVTSLSDANAMVAKSLERNAKAIVLFLSKNANGKPGAFFAIPLTQHRR